MTGELMNLIEINFCSEIFIYTTGCTSLDKNKNNSSSLWQLDSLEVECTTYVHYKLACSHGTECLQY